MFSSQWLRLLLVVALGCTSIVAMAHAGADDDAERVTMTTLFVVRHAQKADPGNNAPDAPLSDAGRRAARRLAETLRSADLAAVFATPTVRARDTAAPTATVFGVGVTEYRGAEQLAEQIHRDWRGRSALIVGHSNTVPAIVRALGGRVQGELGDDEYDNLFIVTIVERGGDRAVSTTRLRPPE